MNTIWKHIRKPRIWGPLFVLSVLAFNVLMGHKIGTTALYTCFASIFTICMANPSGEGYVRRKGLFENTSRLHQKNCLQEASDRRLMTYGSRGNFSIQDRNRMFGRRP